MLFSWLNTIRCVVWKALCIYTSTDGEQRAASFAYYAFFALFPLILLFVSVGSMFLDQHQVSMQITEFVSRYVPSLSDEDNIVMKTLKGVVDSRKRAGAIAVVAILWSSLGFFHALVRGVNRAWGTLEYPWWKLPFTNLGMICIVASALFLGVVTPTVVDAVAAYAWKQQLAWGKEAIMGALRLARLLVPTFVLFYGFTMFYKFAPRRKTAFREVWVAALVVTALLQLLQHLFVLYARNFSNFNAVYGAFGSVVALLMWIYLSGSIIIFGGCLSAAQAEVCSKDDGTLAGGEGV